MNSYDAKWFAQLHDTIPSVYAHRDPEVLRNQPIINNIVYSVNFQCRIEVVFLMQIFRPIGRRRVKFPQYKTLSAPYSNTALAPIITTLLYVSGKHVASGAREVESIIWDAQLRRLNLAYYGIEVGLGRIKLSNVVVHADMNGRLDLDMLADMNSKVTWKPREFTGAMFVVYEGADVFYRDKIETKRGVRVLAFKTGKLVLTGGNSYEQVVRICEQLREMMHPYIIKKQVHTERLAKNTLPKSVRQQYVAAEEQELRRCNVKPSKGSPSDAKTNKSSKNRYTSSRCNRFAVAPVSVLSGRAKRKASTSVEPGTKRVAFTVDA